ncbi:MAG: glycosyltransferase family 39 protein [Chloroflexota bacterium]
MDERRITSGESGTTNNQESDGPFTIRHFPPVGVILLLGFALRTVPLTQNRFHPDEALYATFARLIASGRDPLLSTVVVDKPPLPFYLMAASMSIFGGAELAARLPTLFASLIAIAVIYKLADTLHDKTTANLAALILALSPLAILFAITLFTDTLLAAFLFFSLLMAARQKWTGAGWAFGLAFASKQTALFFLPLIITVSALEWIHRRERRQYEVNSAISALSAVKNFLLPFAFCVAAIFLWDYIRHAPISFWTQGYTDNNPGRLVRSNEIWPRLSAWIDLLQYITGSPVANAVLIVGLPFLLLISQRSLPTVYDFIFAGFTVTFLTGYWLLAFNVWDRYLLVLTPLVALLAGRVFSAAGYWLVAASRRPPATNRLLPSSRASRLLLPAFCLLLTAFCLLPPALTASRSGFPIGGDHGAYDGIDEIAKTLHTVPAGSVLYDHWLSWELGFYLFDGPAYIAWMPGPGVLADDLRSFGRLSPRYIVAPSWESFSEMQTAIEEAGFTTEVIQQTHRRDGTLSFTLYQIKPSAP